VKTNRASSTGKIIKERVMAIEGMNMDVDSPEKVARVLRKAAQEYYYSAGELSSAWQDKNAGSPWNRIARILERAAEQVDKVTGSY
jgi:hypothetical protein